MRHGRAAPACMGERICRHARRGSRGNVSKIPTQWATCHCTIVSLVVAGPYATDVAGMEKLNVAPRSSFDSAQIRPSCVLMIERQMDRPTPMPFALVE